MNSAITMSDLISYGDLIPSRIWPSRHDRRGSFDIMTITIFACDSPGTHHNYTVDCKVITAVSLYFREILKLPSSVAQFKHLDLVDECPEAFEFVLHCMNRKPNAKELMHDPWQFSAGRLSGKALMHDSRQLSAGQLSRTAVYVLAYILALKLGMEGICNQIMDYILHHHDVRDVYSGVLDGKTISSFPDCRVTEFLVEQLAWALAEKGIFAFCKCTKTTAGRWTMCSLCTFKEDQSAGFFSVFTKVNDHVASRSDGSWDKSAEPQKMDHCYWPIHGDGEGQVLSCPEGKVCAMCVKEQGELDNEHVAQAAEKEEKLAAELEIQKEDVLAEYAAVFTRDSAAHSLKRQGSKLRLEALSLDDPNDRPSNAECTAPADDVLSASDFGDFGGR